MRVRVLMWFVVGFTVACAVGVYLVSGMFLALLALFALAAAIPLFFIKDTLCRITAIVLFGLAVGFGWLWGYDSVYIAPARQQDTKNISATVTITDYSYDTRYGVAADGELTISDRDYKVRVYVTAVESLSPGDTVTGEFKLRLTTGDSSEGATYHQGKGIFFLAYADKNAVVTEGNDDAAVYFSVRLRRKITDLIDAAFPEDTLAFARALLLGDSTMLTYEEDTWFKISGIRHIIAVSGLHISILFSLVLMFSGHRRGMIALLGIPVLLLFAAIAGFTPSVVRACIMQLLVILALLFDKEYDPPTALSFAVLVMLGINPMTITSVSFQLSVGCLVGIFLFYQRLYDFFTGKVPQAKENTALGKALRWIFGSASVTLSAISVTTPLSAVYFGTVSLVGILTNILTLWLVSLVFYGIMLVCILGCVWMPGAQIAAWVLSWPIRYIQWIARILSGFSLSAVYTCSVYIVVWLIFCYVLLTVFLWGRRKHPALFAACMCFGLMLAVAASWIEPRLSNYRFTALNVGQGQCLLWQCDGKNYMVDCGGDTPESAADTAAAYLLSQGITHLDGLILTHYDEDHAAGVLPLLSRVKTKRLYLPDIPDEGEIRGSLEAAYRDRICWVDATQRMESGEGSVFFYPASDKITGNESSMCVLFQWQECDILVTGDRDTPGERALLATADLPDLEVLVVGHHGSKNSTCLELLHQTQPELAVISVGRDNSYGHPAADLLKRLELFGCSVWRTDLDKTIIIKG